MFFQLNVRNNKKRRAIEQIFFSFYKTVAQIDNLLDSYLFLKQSSEHLKLLLGMLLFSEGYYLSFGLMPFSFLSDKYTMSNNQKQTKKSCVIDIYFSFQIYHLGYS